MECKNCGFDNRADARFCKQCGQPLEAAPAPTVEQVCLTCGATAKPGARFCPRCGKPMAVKPPAAPRSAQADPPPQSSPAAPAPLSSTVPSMPVSTQPPSPPPPASTPPKAAKPKGGIPSWVWWLVGVLAFVCLIAAVIAGVVLLPDIIESGQLPFGVSPTEAPTPMPSPTETPSPESEEIPSPTPITSPAPPPAFDALVLIEVSTVEMALGERVTVTVTLSNTGEAHITAPRYQLMGDWASALRIQGPQAIGGDGADPNTFEERTFVLEAVTSGSVSLWVDVTMEVEGRQDLEARSSDEITITIP